MEEIKSETKIKIGCPICKERTEHEEVRIDSICGYKIFYECKKCNNRMKPSTAARYHEFVRETETTAIERTIECPKCQERTEHDRRGMKCGGYSRGDRSSIAIYYRCTKCKNNIWENEKNSTHLIKSILKREVVTVEKRTITLNDRVYDEVELCSSGADDHWP